MAIENGGYFKFENECPTSQIWSILALWVFNGVRRIWTFSKLKLLNLHYISSFPAPLLLLDSRQFLKCWSIEKVEKSLLLLMNGSRANNSKETDICILDNKKMRDK